MRRFAPYLQIAALVLLAVRASLNAAQDDAPKSLPHPLIADNFSYDLPDIFWSADGQQLYVAEDQFAWNPLFYAYSLITRDLTFIKSGRDAYLPTVTDAERAEYDMDSVASGDVSQRYIVYGTGERQVSRHRRLPKMQVLDRETGITHPIINVEWNWETGVLELGNPYNLSIYGVALWGQNGGGFVMRFNPPYGGYDPLWRWVSGYAAGKMTRAVPLIDLKVHEELVTPYQVYAVSADSTRLLVAVSGRRLVVWYPDDPDASYIVPGISAETINNAAFHPTDPEQIVAIGQNGLFYIELKTGKVTMLHEGVVQEHRAFVHGSAFSPDGTWLAFQNQDADRREKRGIYLYNLLTNTFDSGHKPIQSIQVSHDTLSPTLASVAWEGNYLAIGDERGVRIYDDEDLTSPIRELNKSNSEPITHVVLSSDARVIGAADSSGMVWLGRDKDMQALYKFDSAVLSIAISSDGSQLAVSGVSQLLLFNLAIDGVAALDLRSYYGIADAVPVAFTPDDKLWVYTKTSPNDEFEKRRSLPLTWVRGTASAYRVAFGTERYVEYVPHTWTVFDYERERALGRLSNNNNSTYFSTHESGFYFAFNDRYIVLVLNPFGGDLVLWDSLEEHPVIRILDVPYENANGPAFSPDGTRLASLTLDGMLHIWELPHPQTEDASAGQ